MTEIVKNSNNMAFDLLETGNNSQTSSGDDKSFNSLFSDVGTNEQAVLQGEEMDYESSLTLEKNMSEIIAVIENSNMAIPEDTLSGIVEGLKRFFDNFKVINPNNEKVKSKLSEEGNRNFIHLMKFLEEIKGLLKQKSDLKPENGEIDLLLDKIRTKLNDQIKAHHEKHAGNALAKISNKTDNENYNFKINNKADEIKPPISVKSSIPKASENILKGSTPGIIEASKVTGNKDYRSKLKSKSSKKIVDDGSKLESSDNNKLLRLKSDNQAAQSISNNNSFKEMFSDGSLGSKSLHSTKNLEIDLNLQDISSNKPSNLNQSSGKKAFENSKTPENLNMLSKSWGSDLIEKIGKSIEDGIEKLEISLTPKSLGRLSLIINVQDSIAKVNIIAETHSVSALLGESEAKLSQMMEANGLKLGSLQTLTQQFGNNKKGKEQSPKITPSKKKDNINNPLTSDDQIIYKTGKKEGLNLIA